MAKIKKYLSSFKNTLVFSFLPVLSFSNFYSEDAPDVWDYGIATVLPFFFIYILFSDIIAYRKAKKELEKDWLKIILSKELQRIHEVMIILLWITFYIMAKVINYLVEILPLLYTT